MTLKREERDQIRALRKEGRTIEEIAEKTGKCFVTVQRLCRDIEPDEERIAAVARPLHEKVYEGREVMNELTHKIARGQELSQELASEVNNYKVIISEFVMARLNELTARRDECLGEIKRASDDLDSKMDKLKRMFEETEQAHRELELARDRLFR